MGQEVFAQKIGKTVNLSATSTSSSKTIDPAAVMANNLRVYNAGPSTAFVTWGTGSATADSTTSVPIPPGAVENFYKGSQADTVAAVCASGGTATVYFTPGEGI